MGFDGWFINEETGGGTSSEWVGFIKEFNKIADENGDTQMEIQWYDASRLPAQEILMSHKNTYPSSLNMDLLATIVDMQTELAVQKLRHSQNCMAVCSV